MEPRVLRSQSWGMRFVFGLLLGTGGMASVGCELPEPMSDGLPAPEIVTCWSCHAQGDTPAPVIDLDAGTATSRLGVGAHRAHMESPQLGISMHCTDCHLVPEQIEDPGHIDVRPAEVTWGAMATQGGAQPEWSRETATCSGVYCHGATLSGGMHSEPKWTRVDGIQIRCGGCHGNPPPPPHPQADDCMRCHPGNVGRSGQWLSEEGLHLNGQVDVAGLTCTSCHGGEGNPAPPISVGGAQQESAVEVGAHQRHLVDGLLRPALHCEACHRVPNTYGDPGHMDGGPAELHWGELARYGGVEPRWDREAETCSNVYCHGVTLAGGQKTRPRWTQIDGEQVACDACHGNPPPSPHPQSQHCDLCHPDTVTVDGALRDGGATHIDGRIDLVELACDVCHGQGGDPAPPPTVSGATDPSDLGVGAHQIHLGGERLGRPIPCEQCHVVPSAVLQEGHIDDGVAEVVFGDLARAHSASPIWDRESETCSNVYCHGATLQGGEHATPQWTRIDGEQTACNGCHGSPPPLPHPNNERCTLCHPTTVRADGTLDTERGDHIDGVVQSRGVRCNACHGNAVNAAPPASVAGLQDVSHVEVGAHQAHLQAASVVAPLSCEHCHPVPAGAGALAHADASPAEVEFGELAKMGDVAPIWDRESETCSNVYCHGATLQGGSDVGPRWTRSASDPIGCGDCHGSPPPVPHPQASDCHSCHETTVDADGGILVAGGAHIDGEVQVAGRCDACHRVAPDTGAHRAHYPGPVAQASYGGVGTGMNSEPPRFALDCGNCHPLDSGDHINGSPQGVGGIAEVDFSASDAPAGSMRARHPSTAAYTPGATVYRDDRGLAYTLGSCADVYCHTPRWIGDGAGGDLPEGEPVPWGESGPLPCTRCHVLSTDDSPQGEGQNGAHIVGDIAADTVREQCQACHVMDAHMSGLPRIGLADGTTVQVSGDGGDAAVNEVCMSCHDGTGSAIAGRTPPVMDSYDDPDGGDFHGVRAGSGFGGELLPPYERGQGPLPCTACHGAHRGANPYLIALSVGETPILANSIDRMGTGAEALCETCHIGERHAACFESCHQDAAGGGRDPAPPGVACFYCHSHRGIINFEFPDERNHGIGSVGCSHCHAPARPWPENIPPRITVPVDISDISHDSVTITWSTNELSTSWVEYGVGAPSDTGGSRDYVLRHRVVLTGLQPAQDYVFRVRSVDRMRNAVTSDLSTFATASEGGPLPPALIDAPHVHAYTDYPPAPTLPVTLRWHATQIPDGGAVEYRVEVSESDDFSAMYADSGWIAETFFDLQVQTVYDVGAPYFWRVMARDAVRGLESPWSGTDSFRAYAWDLNDE